jgi:hypothetical protein
LRARRYAPPMIADDFRMDKRSKQRALATN